MKLRTRLILTFSILLAIPAAFYAVVDSMSSTAERFQKQMQLSHTGIQAINSLNTSVNRQIFETVDVMIHGRALDEGRRAHARAEVSRGFTQMEKATLACIEARTSNGGDDDEVELAFLVKSLRDQYQTIAQGLDRGLKLSSDGKGEEAKALLSTIVEKEYNVEFAKRAQELTAHEADELTEDVNNLARSLQKIRFAVLGLFAFSVLLIFATAFLAARYIRSKLQPLLEAIDRISHRDFEFQLPNLGKDEFGKLSAAFNSMVSSLKEARREVADHQEKLVNSSKMSALGEMASGIAHEINNPLGALTLKAEQLKEVAESGTLDPTWVAQTADKIVSTALRIRKIVHSLKTFARDNSRDDYQLASPHDIVSETLELCQDRLARGAVRLDMDIPKEIPQFECQSVQVGQVLLNLINNAYDAIEAYPEKWIRLALREHEGHVEFSVTDCGPGIPPAMREKILEPFFTTKGIGKGTGLGLSISRRIVKEHGGRFQIDADCPNTRFVFSFPVRQSRSPASQKTAA